MSQQEEPARRREGTPNAEKQALEILREFAADRGSSVPEAAEAALSNWTKNWCEATPFGDSVSSCEVYGRLQNLAKKSDDHDSPEGLVQSVLSEE